MIELRVTLEGDQAAIRVVKNLKAAVDDFSPAWPAVVRRLRAQEARLFTSQGASGASGAWAPLSPRYAAWKSRHFHGRTILELSGRMRAALQVETPDTIIEYDSRFLFYGADVPYGTYHMTGTDTMPARPPISPTPRDAAEWMAEISRYFDATVSRGYGAWRVGRAA